MTNLLPCPFCGGEAVHSIGKNGDGSDWSYVECLACSATAEPAQWNIRYRPDGKHRFYPVGDPFTRTPDEADTCRHCGCDIRSHINRTLATPCPAPPRG